jgi:hypothetical protein
VVRCHGAVRTLGSPYGREPVKPAEVPLDGGELSSNARLRWLLARLIHRRSHGFCLPNQA